MLLFFFIFFSLKNVLSLKSSGIVLTVSNALQYTNYTFKFIPSTYLPPKSTVELTFPYQYLPTLGIDIIKSTTCSHICTISDYVVTFQLINEVNPNTEVTLQIYNVKNPDSKGGIGDYKLRTKKTDFLFEENRIFGSLGIGDTPNRLMGCILSAESKEAGLQSKYYLSFKNGETLEKNSFLTLSIPPTALYKFPANLGCQTYSINGFKLPSISCEVLLNSNQILFRGVDNEISAKNEIGITFSLINPAFSLTTEVFSLQIYKYKTSMVTNMRMDMPSLTITPGKLSNVVLKPAEIFSTITMSKIMKLELAFTTKNEIPVNGIIYIEFPNGFEILFNTGLDEILIVSGLNDQTSLTTKIDFDRKYIVISKFAKVNPVTVIKINVLVQIPNTFGNSVALKINTYKDESKTIIIDQDISSALVNVQSLPSSLKKIPIGVTSSNTYSNGNINNLLINIFNSIAIPINGFIEIKFPTGFIVSTFIAASDCFSDNGITAVPSCSNDPTNTRIVKMKLGVVFNVGTGNLIALKNRIQNPNENGTYFIEINTYGTDGTTLLESFSDYISLSGQNLLSTYSVKLYGASVSAPPEMLYSILVFKMTLAQDLPKSDSGTIDSSITQGIIIFKILSGWDYDLGSGFSDGSRFPCLGVGTGLTNVFCILRIGSIAQSTTVEVRGFDAMLSGSIFEVHFPNVKSPVTVGTFIWEAFIAYRRNRVIFSLNYASFSITLSAAVITTSGTTTYTLSSILVSTAFDLSFPLKLTSNIVPNDYIILELPTYDIGYFSDSSNIVCKIASTTETCKPYVSNQFILIKSSSTYNAASNPTATILGLKWPRNKFSTISVGINERLLDGASLAEKEILKLNTMGIADYDVFTKANVNSNKILYGEVDAMYTFEFQANNAIFKNCLLNVDLPGIYNLLSTPRPTFFSTDTNLQGAEFQIVNFQQFNLKVPKDINANTLLTFKILGLKNPSYGDVSSGWSVYTTYEDKLVNKKTGFTLGFMMAKTFTPYNIGLIKNNVVPKNAGLNADYCFEFESKSTYDLPIGTIFEIYFPSTNFSSFPIETKFNISGAINYFESIYYFGSTYYIQTATKIFFTNQKIKLCLNGIANPSNKGFTENFKLKYKYDGVYIAQLDSTVNLNFEMIASPIVLNVDSLSLDPLNEGEETIMRYIFYAPTNLNSSYVLHIIFPDSYDLILSRKSIECSGISNINSGLTCSVENRILIISNILSGSMGNKIEIEISNIINPYYKANSNTGYIKAGLKLSKAGSYIAFNEKASIFSILQPPNYCTINSIQMINNYVRLKTDYTFNITFYQSIPNSISLGKITIIFPDEFDIPNQSSLTCSLLNSNQLISCSVTNNIVSITSDQDSLGGTLIIFLSQIQNPINAGSIGQFIIKTYDGYNRLILEKSYYNLNPLEFSYVIKGLPVIINSDMTVEVQTSTQSDMIYIVLENPSFLNLTFKAYTTGFTIIPSSISLNVGMVSASFRVSIPKGFAIGIYYILWETLNDPSLKYTPLRKTVVSVVDNKIQQISVVNIFDIPLGGHSLPIYFKINNPPDSAFQVVITFDNSTVIYASPNVLTFSSGTLNMQTIFYSRNVSLDQKSAKYFFKIIGVDANSFDLAVKEGALNILDNDIEKPVLNGYSVWETQKTFVNFNMQSNKPCLVYYMVALAGTDTPPFQELKDKGPPPYQTSLSTYDQIVVATSATLKITNLKASMNYTISFYVEDQLEITNGPYNLIFQTLEIVRAAEFSIRVSKNPVSSNEKLWLKKNIAYAMALNESNLIERKYNFGALPYVEDSQTQSIVYFYLVANPTNTLMGTPIKVAEDLGKKLTELQTYYSNVDEKYVLTYSETIKYIPDYIFPPNITNYTQNSLTFNVSLNNFGILFLIGIDITLEEKEFNVKNGVNTNTTVSIVNLTNLTNASGSTVNSINDTTTQNNSKPVFRSNINDSYPTSLQISRGLNRYNANWNVLAYNFEISEKNKNYTFQIDTLKSNNSYYFFFTCGNVYENKEFLDSSKIIGLEIRTLAAVLNITTSYGHLISILNIGLFLIIFAITS